MKSRKETKEKRKKRDVFLVAEAPVHYTRPRMHQSGQRRGALKASADSRFLTTVEFPGSLSGPGENAFKRLSHVHAYSHANRPARRFVTVGGKAQINIKRELERYVVKIDP